MNAGSECMRTLGMTWIFCQQGTDCDVTMAYPCLCDVIRMPLFRHWCLLTTRLATAVDQRRTLTTISILSDVLFLSAVFRYFSTMAEHHHTHEYPLPDIHRLYEGPSFRIYKALIRKGEFGVAAEDLDARTWEVIRKFSCFLVIC